METEYLPLNWVGLEIYSHNSEIETRVTFNYTTKEDAEEEISDYVSENTMFSMVINASTEVVELTEHNAKYSDNVALVREEIEDLGIDNPTINIKDSIEYKGKKVETMQGNGLVLEYFKEDGTVKVNVPNSPVTDFYTKDIKIIEQ